MRLYVLLDRLFPRSFVAKVLAVTFCGTHVPLVAWCAASPFLPRVTPQTTMLVLLAATLAGTGATFVALAALLRPIRQVANQLTTWDEGLMPARLPDVHRDEVGRLMRQSNRLIDRATDRLGRRRTEAETDPLTGALNRRGAEAWLADGAGGWVASVDIDRFKEINDRWGHAAGDEILRAVTRALRGALRPDDMLARWGGEEFLVVLPDLEASEARIVAERLRKAVETKVRTREGRVTVSVGLAPHQPGADLAGTLVQADAALYLAKERGRNRVCGSEDPAEAA